MTTWRHSAFALLLLVFGTASAHAKGRRPPQVSFEVDPATVTAGRTMTVRCTVDVPLKNPTIFFKDRKAQFYPIGENQWRAFLGISSMEDPGPKEAAFYAKLPRGKVFHSTVNFQVQGGTYPVSRVGLSRQKDEIITSGKLEEDAKVLETIYREPQAFEKLWAGYFILPTTGIVSSPYGARRAYARRVTYTAHTGTDIANVSGTLIAAPGRGRVVLAQWLDSFGHSVMLDHGLGVYTYYLHMQTSTVKPGDFVESGMPLGEMGAEGLATGPHLHWSLVVSGERVEPLEWTEKEFK